MERIWTTWRHEDNWGCFTHLVFYKLLSFRSKQERRLDRDLDRCRQEQELEYERNHHRGVYTEIIQKKIQWTSLMLEAKQVWREAAGKRNANLNMNDTHRTSMDYFNGSDRGKKASQFLTFLITWFNPRSISQNEIPFGGRMNVDGSSDFFPLSADS